MDQGQNMDIVLALPANPKANSFIKRKICPQTTALDQFEGQKKDIVLALPANATAKSFTSRGYVAKMKEKNPLSTNETIPANPIDEHKITPIEKPSAAM
nr:uncharacterized protein LOC109167829 [Ipomoea batatas]